MNTHGDDVDTRAVGGDGPVRRARTTVVAGLTAALAAALLAVSVAPAAAATTSTTSTTTTNTSTTSTSSQADQALQSDPAQPDAPTADQSDRNQQSLTRPGAGTPSSAPTSTPTTPPTGRPPVDPTIADPGDVTSATGRFHGTATPGHRVRVMDPGVASSSVCTAMTSAAGTWSCTGTVHTGPQQVFTVQDVSDPSRHTADAPAADVVVPPTITTREPTTGTVVGSGDAGTTVTVSVSGSSAVRTATVGSDGRWVVSWSTGAAPHPSGTVTMTATQTGSTAKGYRSDLRSAASAPASVTFDRTPPAAPRISAPRSGQRIADGQFTVRGTGEPAAELTVYVDRAPVCGTTVGADGSWSCSTRGVPLTAGARSVTALQHDAAGNHSASSTAVVVRVAGAAGSTPGSPSGGATTPGATTPGGTGTGHGTPGTGGTGGTTPGGGTGGGAGGTGEGTGPGSGAGSTGAGAAPGTTGGPGHGVDWSGPAGDWSVATTFDQTVPTIQSSFSWRTLLVAAAVAAAFLLLVAGPLRLVVRSLRGRVPLRLASFTGRNRPRAERRRGDDTLPGWVSVGIAVVLATVLALLGVGVELEARYVRLAIAVLLGTAVLAAAVVLATRWAAGTDRHTVGYRVSPWLVLAALVGCAVTRTADLSPALVVGVLLVPVGRTDVDTGAMRLGAGVAACARSATWRSAALLVLAAAGWVLHSLTPGSGFWVSLVSEFAITLCVGGLGSLVVTLLPLTGSAGGALWAHSRARYASIAAVGVALGAAVYSGSAGTHVSPVVMAVVACACVAVAAATWVWVRVLEPDARA
ncbi:MULTISPECIES: Ig-like domain-containing protein [unclassified Curtobacterium]|uniref:Ig-like domain-containing protein n=1 Tax=unclassified Curtobacterium TaxID=257496 RepID=UPI003828130F